MSVGIAYALGISSDVIRQGIRSTRHVDGRFEKIDEGQNFLCIVDYAHTEDALEKLIETSRPITSGRVITVFGCGGDRDITKRPRMGMVATEKSDFVIITSDNPRSESPEVIVRDIVRGINKSNYKVQHDRGEAIKDAVMMAEKGDTLLVAGKGHEDYQDINGIRHHFSDKEILRNEIRGILKVNK
jgi:UDP-N-acetylmuramoyl-L-alanyl-D-glutamate--2,6-diaminopimelate ligase